MENTLADLGSKLANGKLLATLNSEFNEYMQPTKSLQSPKVSIEVVENTVNTNLIPSFFIKLSGQQQNTALDASDIQVTLVYTVTAVNGNDYTGRSTMNIAAGTSGCNFELLDKIKLKDNDFEKIVISITEVKSTGSEKVIIDENNYCREVDIIERPKAYLSIEEVSIDEGIVEFKVSLSGDQLASEATVDYIIGEIITYDSAPTILESGTLTFDPGITSHTITIPIVDEIFSGYYEVVKVALSNAVNAIILDKSKISSLTNINPTDLDAAIVSIATSSLAVNEGNVATFMLELSDSEGHLKTASTDIIVDIFYSATSINDTDFVGIEKVVIPANSSSVDFEITALDEYISEAAETINIKLTQAIGGCFKTITFKHNQSSVDITMLDGCRYIDSQINQGIEFQI